MSLLEVKIITPEGVVYDSDGISSVTIPTTEGIITVLPGHIPLIAPIKTGEAHLIKDGVTLGLAVSGGIMEVRDNVIKMLAERGELAHDIDVARAEDAYKRAEQAMKMEESIADIDYAKIQSALEKELNRINVGKKWRK